MGFRQRILGGPPGFGPVSCPADNAGAFVRGRNYWHNDNNLYDYHAFGNPGWPHPDDPRLVTLFLTPYVSFNGEGLGVTPIAGFISFYITGWRGPGSPFATDPCPGNQQPPDMVTLANQGYVWGHIVKEVVFGAIPSDRQCRLDAFEPCVPVLTE
jgi:hypothetical protein